MHLYRQTIILFGIVLPLIAIAALVGVCFMIQSNMAASLVTKEANYKIAESGRRAAHEVETQVASQRQHLERWTTQLSQETASTATTHLREISGHLPAKEIYQTAFDQGVSSGFGTISKQKSSQLRIAFRGTYRTLQRAFLELETRMPQLQLQELKIDSSSTQSSLLNLQVTYTAWEN
jgi:hypothetical protein